MSYAPLPRSENEKEGHPEPDSGLGTGTDSALAAQYRATLSSVARERSPSPWRRVALVLFVVALFYTAVRLQYKARIGSPKWKEHLEGWKDEGPQDEDDDGRNFAVPEGWDW